MRSKTAAIYSSSLLPCCKIIDRVAPAIYRIALLRLCQAILRYLPGTIQRNRIYRAGGLDPAMVHLERNLISISLKEQLLARPAFEDLERRGIKPREGGKVLYCTDQSVKPWLEIL